MKAPSKVVVDVTQNVLAFYECIIKDPHHRYRSWDHCYSYFQDLAVTTIATKNIDLAALHLAFYLASWGMYRGSSFILWKDYRIHVPAVRLLLEEEYRQLWNPTLEERPDLNTLFTLASQLNGIYVESAVTINGVTVNRTPTNTLVTKILLGTLACTPAYDRLVCDGMKHIKEFPATFSQKGYSGCIDFFRRNLNEFEDVQAVIARHGDVYPPMKLIDMYFWSIGNQLEQERRKAKQRMR